MEYRKLALGCECGGVPKSISAVGFSAAHELVVHWRCPRCHKNLCVVKPLSDCWQECSRTIPASAPQPDRDPVEETRDDRRFLHSIGVRFPD